jgi:hypothetical protein
LTTPDSFDATVEFLIDFIFRGLGLDRGPSDGEA